MLVRIAGLRALASFLMALEENSQRAPFQASPRPAPARVTEPRPVHVSLSLGPSTEPRPVHVSTCH